jgi:hypothetical protein
VHASPSVPSSHGVLEVTINESKPPSTHIATAKHTRQGAVHVIVAGGGAVPKACEPETGC